MCSAHTQEDVLWPRARAGAQAAASAQGNDARKKQTEGNSGAPAGRGSGDWTRTEWVSYLEHRGLRDMGALVGTLYPKPQEKSSHLTMLGRTEEIRQVGQG